MPQPQPDRYVFIYHRLTVVELLLCCLEKKKKKKRKEKKKEKKKKKKGGGGGGQKIRLPRKFAIVLYCNIKLAFLLTVCVWVLFCTIYMAVSDLVSMQCVITVCDLVSMQCVTQVTVGCFGPHIWNSLPQDLRHCSTLSSFKAKLKTFLFSQYFHPN